MRLPQRRLDRLRQIEVQLRDALPDERGPIALQATGEVFGSAGVSLLERDAAAAALTSRLPVDWSRRPELADEIAYELAAMLETVERRRAVRAAVTEMVETACAEMPLLARELEDILAAPAPTGSDDVVWVAAVMRSFGRE